MTATKVKNSCDIRKGQARKKYLSNKLVIDLTNYVPDSPLVKSYWNTYHCREVIRVEDGKSRATYCKNRWCLTCQSIRIGALINGYEPALNALKEPYFVTLTAPTVQGDQLEDRVKDFGHKWRRLMNSSAQRKMNLQGVRKAECTARPNNHYHYHFHVVVDGKANAEWMRKRWLQLNPTATIKANDIRPVDTEKGWKELFKYFTKLTTKLKNDKRVNIPADRLDVIFNAMRGRRVYQPFGDIRAVSEDIEEINEGAVEVDEGLYKWLAHDWYNDSTGELYSGYIPSTKEQNTNHSDEDKIFDHCKFERTWAQDEWEPS